VDYIIYECFISFIIAFNVTFASTPMVRKFAFKVGAVDDPKKDNRRMHKKPIARLGGIAIIAGFLLSVFFNIITALFDNYAILRLNTQEDYMQFLGMLVGIFIIVIVAYFDDINPLSAGFKFVFQILAALVVIYTGTRIEFVTDPFFSSTGLSYFPIYVSYIISLLWIVGITNAINFIDGLDGLAVGVSSIASLSLFFVSIMMDRPETAVLSVILAGSSLGFLPYNFNPAKIFMGDTGSTFLGFTLAVISIQGTIKYYAAIAITVPLLVLGLPLFDTISAIVRRIISGKSPMKADRSHLHHKLMDMGLSHRQSVVVMYIASSVLGLVAVVLADRGPVSAIILIISVSIFVIGGAKYMTDLNDDAEIPDKKNIKKENTTNKKSITTDIENKNLEDKNKLKASKTTIPITKTGKNFTKS
jgi:UDP-GlcNAc:undecaprenyl-phosphate GlcNAc-1-phosphate transferase